jgi:hypothetical protein
MNSMRTAWYRRNVFAFIVVGDILLARCVVLILCGEEWVRYLVGLSRYFVLDDSDFIMSCVYNQR